MTEVKNTPPHAQLTITVLNDLNVDEVNGLHNSTVKFSGCSTCTARVMADLMAKNEEFRNIMFKSLMIYSIEAAKKAIDGNQS